MTRQNPSSAIKIGRVFPLILLVYALMACDQDGGPYSPAAAHAQENLVRNGDFDAPSNGVPTHWVLDKAVANKGVVSLVDVEGHGGGGRTLKLSPNQANAAGSQPLGLAQVIPAAGLGGKQLKVSLRLGAQGGAMAVAGVTVLGQGGAKVGKLRFSQGGNGGRLETKEGVIQMPDAQAKHLIVFIAVAGTKGAAYFDEIVIEPVGGHDGDAAVPGSEGSLQAKINVYADQKIRDIPRSLYGTNLNWVDHGNSIFDPRTFKPNPTIVQLAKELNVSLVRFPGGTLGDYYHWRDGVGPQSSRPSTAKYGKDKKERHTVGTDEALDFAQKLGANLLVVANMGSGTADEAAQWVEYINAGDKPNAQRVTHWEIGNELYFAPQGNHLTMEPEEYASRFIDYAKAMKRVDPSIKVGAIGGENFGSYQFVHYPDWNRKVLARVAKHVDFFAVHNAYAPILHPHESPDGRSLYAALLAAPINVRRNLELIGRQIETHTGRNADRIKIAVTEWGPLFAVGTDSPYVDHTKTLGSALFVASMLGTFIDMPRVEIANFFKLSEHTFMGWIGPRGFTGPFNGEWVPKATYYAFQLYTKHFGQVLVRSTTESPTYNSLSVGKVEAVQGVPYLETRASTSQDGQTLYLMVINKHFDRAMQTQVRIDGFKLKRRGTARVLHGTGLDANTGTELPAWIPGIAWAKQAQVKPGRRFYSGKQSNVKVSSVDIKGVASTWAYTFPPCSVTSLELHRDR